MNFFPNYLPLMANTVHHKPTLQRCLLPPPVSEYVDAVPVKAAVSDILLLK